MRYLSCFSGIEAASVAWKPLGFEAVGFSEIEPFPCAVLKHHFPQTTNYGDITKHTEWNIEPGTVDLLVGGSPCQAFSVAGLRQGLADPRGNLALTFLGLADRLRPKWIVWENVPGVLSSNGGSDFASFLGALGQLGYGWAYRVLNAEHFGVPQRRNRVFLVATSLGDSRIAAEVLSLGEGLRGYLETRQQKGKGVAANVGKGVEADGRKPIVIDRAAFNQGENAQYEPHIAESDVMDSLVARGPHAVGVSLPIPLDLRNATRNPEKHDEQNRQGVGVGNHGDPSHTLTKEFVHGVAQHIDPKIVRTSELRLQGKITEQEICPTLTANNKSGDTEPLALTPIAFQPGNLRRKAGADPSADCFPTVKCDAGDQAPHIATPPPTMAVRRLTPKECERLQGFPDDWTLIPWKGKPADQCPDGPRYKACGNSMAVPCMAWIGKRLAEVHSRIFETK